MSPWCFWYFSKHFGDEYGVYRSIENKNARVLIYFGGAGVYYDRLRESVEKGFPELKVLKQMIRDFVSPEKDLGHSDSEH